MLWLVRIEIACKEKTSGYRNYACLLPFMAGEKEPRNYLVPYLKHLALEEPQFSQIIIRFAFFCKLICIIRGNKKLENRNEMQVLLIH